MVWPLSVCIFNLSDGILGRRHWKYSGHMNTSQTTKGAGREYSMHKAQHMQKQNPVYVLKNYKFYTLYKWCSGDVMQYMHYKILTKSTFY